MKPAVAIPDLKTLEELRKHEFSAKANVPPDWQGAVCGWVYQCYERVCESYDDFGGDADFLAENLASGSAEWNFRRVGIKDKLLS